MQQIISATRRKIKLSNVRKQLCVQTDPRLLAAKDPTGLMYALDMSIAVPQSAHFNESLVRRSLFYFGRILFA